MFIISLGFFSPVALTGFETWCLTLSEENKMRVLVNILEITRNFMICTTIQIL